MESNECIFCKIVKGEMPAHIIYSDKNHMAFLDIFPNITGQSLVITKKHVESYAFGMGDNDLAGLIRASKKTAKILEKGLGVTRVHLAIEGTGVNHVHVKLYPAIGLKSLKFKEFKVKRNVYFKRYPGYLTTMMGPKASDASLKRLQKRIAKK